MKLCIIVFLCIFAVPALAAPGLTIGVEVETTSIDPHFQNTTGNYTVARQIFEPLVFQDSQQHLIPGLALSWAARAPREWEFHLRPGVIFHDGHAFTGADVAFTLQRASSVPNSPNGFGLYTRQIEAVSVIDPLTVRITTKAPDLLLPTELSTVLIVSATTAGHSATADFDSGRAAIGTGPYRFSAWQRNERVLLQRNPAYWGAAPAWDEVALAVIGNPASRVAAMLAHDVDMIDAVPATTAASLHERADIALFETVSSRLLFLQLDTARTISPYVTGADGQPLPNNPLHDPRVRRALSNAVDRDALVTQIMQGHATAAAQLLPDGFTSTVPGLKVTQYDPDGARRLLAEAGYPDGFSITLNCPTNRYSGDQRLGEAVAQMWSRIGVLTRLDTQPGAVLLGRLQHQESSAFLWGWASETGEPSGALRALVGGFDSARGWGSSNRLRYDNPTLDAVLTQALTTMDPSAQAALFQEATKLAINDGGILPLLFLNASWALRGDLTYTVNPMGYSFAFDVHPR